MKRARWILIFCSVLALSACFSVGLVLGLLAGEGQGYQKRFLEERDAIAPILAADPVFASVTINQRSSGGIYLGGEVPTRADLDRLRSHVFRMLGEVRGSEVMIGVSLRR